MEIFWDQLKHTAWERLADRAQAPMQQRWTYGEVHRGLGGQVHRAVLRENGQVIAICQCLTRKFGGILPVSLATRGPLFLASGDPARAITLIRRTLPAPRPRLSLFTLAKPMRNWRLIPMMTPATFAIGALPIQRDSLQGKWRNALKKAENNGLHVDHSACTSQSLERLLHLDTAQQSLKSYTALPPAFSQIWHGLAPQDFRLFSAREQGRVIASALFLQHGNTATYHIAHSNARGRALSAARLLLWHAYQGFEHRGVGQIDLGVIDTENAPGLARFKLGSGAQPIASGPSVLAL